MKRVVTGFGGLLFALIPGASCALAQGSTGVGGIVRDLHGVPQMGALVELLAPDATVVAQTYTDDHGRYLLQSLSPGRYQLRASAAFLLPSLRPNLLINPGVRALANLTMTAVVDIGSWFPAQGRAADESSDDWRWTLRSAANRPLLRLDGVEPALESISAERSNHNVLRENLSVLSGDGSFADSGTHQLFAVQQTDGASRAELIQADFGQLAVKDNASSFDVSTVIQRKSVLGGTSQLAAGFSSHPEISASGGTGLQAFTLASSERIALGDAVIIDAGTLLSAERLAQSRLSSSPFVRLVISPASGFAMMYRYAGDRSLQSSEDMSRIRTETELLSDRDGRPLDLRSAHQEFGLSRKSGKDTETILVYRDTLRNGSVAGLGVVDERAIAALPLVVDSGSHTFHLATNGYIAHGVGFSWTHELGAALTTGVALEVGSALEAGHAPLTEFGVASGLMHGMEPSIRVDVRGRIDRTGTHYRVQYRWQPQTTLDSVDAFNNVLDQAYLSCSLRQKLWSGRRLQGVDAVVEATNLLEEGYQPMVGPDGQTLMLAQVPRTMQAGLSFSF